MVGSVGDICNMAIAHIRAREIPSIEAQTVEGSNCKKFYQQSVDETLRLVDWSFARTYAHGVPAPSAPYIPGWARAFQYPANCAAIRRIARYSPVGRVEKYELSQASGVRLIYTNATAPVFVYTSKSVPISAYDDEFVKALSYILASYIAIPVTGKAELMTGMQQLARGALALAQASNHNEEPEALDDPVPDWLSVRGVPSYSRDQRSADMGGWYYAQPAGLYALPGQLEANPLPPMITEPGPQILPAYIPGLTAPVPPPEPILGTDEIYLHSDGGEILADGSVVYDLPPGTVNADPIEGDF